MCTLLCFQGRLKMDFVSVARQLRAHKATESSSIVIIDAQTVYHWSISLITQNSYVLLTAPRCSCTRTGSIESRSPAMLIASNLQG